MRCSPLALLLVACSGPPGPLGFRVDVPVEPEDRALILSVEGQDRFELIALEISEAGLIEPLDVGFDLSESLTLTALLYDEPLETIGLEPGPVQRISGGGRALPDPDRMSQLSYGQRAVTDWVEQSQLPESLQQVRLERINACNRFTPVVVPLGLAGSPQLVLALDQRWVFVGTYSAVSFLVDREGAVIRLEDLPTSFLAGYVERNGRIWLGGADGVVYEATLDAQAPSLGVSAVSTLASGQPIWALDGPDGAGEQVALGWSPGVEGNWSSVEHFDGTSWAAPLGTRRDPHNITYAKEGLAFYATHFRDAELRALQDRQELCTWVETLNFGHLIEIQSIPELGLVAGTSGSEVHLLRGEPLLRQCDERAVVSVGSS